MNHNSAKNLINQYCFVNGRCRPNLNRHSWWEKRELVPLKDYVLQYTYFLDDNTRWVRRLWHVINDRIWNCGTDVWGNGLI